MEGELGDYGRAQPLVDLARDDLAQRLRVSRKEITVRSVQGIEFPDTSLGVPESGRVYAQVITPGYIIILIVDNAVYEYHGSGNRIVFAPNK